MYAIEETPDDGLENSRHQQFLVNQHEKTVDRSYYLHPTRCFFLTLYLPSRLSLSTNIPTGTPFYPREKADMPILNYLALILIPITSLASLLFIISSCSWTSRSS